MLRTFLCRAKSIGCCSGGYISRKEIRQEAFCHHFYFLRDRQFQGMRKISLDFLSSGNINYEITSRLRLGLNTITNGIENRNNQTTLGYSVINKTDPEGRTAKVGIFRSKKLCEYSSKSNGTVFKVSTDALFRLH